jgi:hypothetical protein
MDFPTEIQKLYKKIPPSVCGAGCFKCCINSIQLSPEECSRIGGYEYNGCCPHLTDKGCAVYNDRPFICRLYGASRMFECNRCIPDFYLGEDETRQLLHEYLKIKASQENS